MPELHHRAVHGAAVLTAVITFCLILAGGLVTSRDAGLAVPDWPLSYGSLNPPRWYAIENVRTEHGHRLIAGLAALATLGLACLVKLYERRRWVRRLALAALIAVVIQAALGGLRVLSLSLDLAVVHGLLGQIFFSVACLLAASTSKGWPSAQTAAVADPPSKRLSLALVVLVLVQLLLGLHLRHLATGATSLADGEAATSLLLAPSLYGHLAVALAVVVVAFRLPASLRAQRHAGATPGLLDRTASRVCALVVVQWGLGLGSLLVADGMSFDRQASLLESWLPTLHVGIGALILAGAALMATGLHWDDREPATIAVRAPS